MGLTFMVVGALVLVTGLGMWLAQLSPGRGHLSEARAELARRPMPVTSRRKGVEQLRPGMPGYRARLPERSVPCRPDQGRHHRRTRNAAPRLPLWSGKSPRDLVSRKLIGRHGPARHRQNERSPTGAVQPDDADPRYCHTRHDFDHLWPSLRRVIANAAGHPHSLAKLPPAVSSLAWGGLIFPILWSSISYSLMGVVNPVLQERVNWPWFIASQFVFGVVAAIVVGRSEKIPVAAAGHRPQ